MDVIEEVRARNGHDAQPQIAVFAAHAVERMVKGPDAIDHLLAKDRGATGDVFISHEQSIPGLRCIGSPLSTGYAQRLSVPVDALNVGVDETTAGMGFKVGDTLG